MPPVPNPMLRDAQVATLQSWVDGGMEPRTGTCEEEPDAGTDVEEDGGSPILDPELDPSICEYQFKLPRTTETPKRASPTRSTPATSSTSASTSPCRGAWTRRTGCGSAR